MVSCVLTSSLDKYRLCLCPQLVLSTRQIKVMVNPHVIVFHVRVGASHQLGIKKKKDTWCAPLLARLVWGWAELYYEMGDNALLGNLLMDMSLDWLILNCRQWEGQHWDWSADISGMIWFNIFTTISIHRITTVHSALWSVDCNLDIDLTCWPRNKWF